MERSKLHIPFVHTVSNGTKSDIYFGSKKWTRIIKKQNKKATTTKHWVCAFCLSILWKHCIHMTGFLR